ncbi:MAG: NAD(P)/FAD-dependent oxidoreductase [candidate division Zixibacteria bacterium]
MKPFDVAIIGGGPAGIAAAIQLSRSGRTIILFEGERIGGMLSCANLIENYPGFEGGIRGEELAAIFQKQLAEHPVTIVKSWVTSLEYDSTAYTVHSELKTIQSASVIVASGTKAKALINLELPNNGHAMISDTVAPVSNVTNKHIAIIGSGDAAFDYALNLSRKNEVTVFCRTETVTCLPLLSERASSDPSINCVMNSLVQSVKYLKGSKLKLDYSNGRADSELEVDYLITAIGREARLDFLSERILKQSDQLRASKRYHLIGDATGTECRQTAIAVGQGVKAAMEINIAMNERESCK